jgi:hypothetical protein
LSTSSYGRYVVFMFQFEAYIFVDIFRLDYIYVFLPAFIRGLCLL